MSRDYTPDSWVLVELERGSEKITKVLAGWYGGYTWGDSWKLSSGVEKVEKEGNVYKFTNYSGSVYICHEGAERLSGMTSGVLATFTKQMEDNGGSAKVISAEEFTRLSGTTG